MCRTGNSTLYLLAIAFSLWMSGCKSDRSAGDLAVTIRLASEPDAIHPIYSKLTTATQIESLILLPLAEFDPVTLKLTPLLIDAIPKPEVVTSGKHKNGTVYRLQFRKEAVWSDGSPITGEDYLFSVKSVYNPYVTAQSWRSFLDFISEIEIDPADPKKVSVYVDSVFILALETVTNFNLYPAYAYDKEKIMSSFSLDDLRKPGMQWSAEQDTLLKQFAAAYESPTFLREGVAGSGAYELDNWTTGEFIRLKRKQNWWGDQVANAPLLLKAYPSQITYRIVLDAAATEAALKTGELDIAGDIPASDFVSLQNDPEWKEKLQFASPPLLQINYLEINTRDSILADPRIRQALAYSIDYDGIMKEMLQGLGERTIGPIHPGKPYYNKSLKPISQDINKSIALIKDAGWKDSNGNGIPDKTFGGKLRELEIHFKIPNKADGIAISNILKENAKQAGIVIIIEALDPNQFNQDIRQRNFELATSRVPSPPELDDPFQVWHSESDREGGSNRSGYHTPELDSVITIIRTSDTAEERNKAYTEFQEIIYRDQPSIWLYVPLERIVASRRLELVTSARRPGYFENLLKPAE